MERIIDFTASLGSDLNDLPRQVKMIENEGKIEQVGYRAWGNMQCQFISSNI